MGSPGQSIPPSHGSPDAPWQGLISLLLQKRFFYGAYSFFHFDRRLFAQLGPKSLVTSTTDRLTIEWAQAQGQIRPFVMFSKKKKNDQGWILSPLESSPL